MAPLRLLRREPSRLAYSLPIRSASDDLVVAWQVMTEAGSRPMGPFLHPSYVRAVGEVRPGVEVAVLTERDEAVGFFPYRRSPLGVGGVVGSKLCDFSGAVLSADVDCDPTEVARAIGLRALRLTNVPTTVQALRPYLGSLEPAPFIDLSGGYDAYRQTRLDSGSSLVRNLEMKASRLERARGPIRFEWHTTEDSVHQALLEWKARQRRATRTPDILSLPWARALMERLRRCEERGFAGVLSALYAGDTLAAAHFGIRTDRVLHYWIPAYNEELGRDSPGLLCLMHLAQAAAARGIERIDLGPGDEGYKARVASDTHWVGTATVTTTVAVRACLRTVDAVRAWTRGSRLGEWLRASGRAATRGAYAVRSRMGVIGRLGRKPAKSASSNDPARRIRAPSGLLLQPEQRRR